MLKPEIVIDIDENGNIIFEVNNAKGKGCKELTEALEKALGEINSMNKKPEYDQFIGNKIIGEIKKR